MVRAEFNVNLGKTLIVIKMGWRDIPRPPIILYVFTAELWLRTAALEHGCHAANGFHEAVHLVERVVHGKRCAHHALHTIAVH